MYICEEHSLTLALFILWVSRGVVPPFLFSSVLGQLLPLLLEALSCPDQGVQVSTLSCLQPVLLDPPSALITQLEVLVGRTLALTTSPTMVCIML